MMGVWLWEMRGDFTPAGRGLGVGEDHSRTGLLRQERYCRALPLHTAAHRHASSTGQFFQARCRRDLPLRSVNHRNASRKGLLRQVRYCRALPLLDLSLHGKDGRLTSGSRGQAGGRGEEWEGRGKESEVTTHD